jgi:hypothetical protein
MQTHVKRVLARVSCGRGCVRSIRPNRARDEDLRIFLRLSERSFRVTARDLDQMIRPA